MNEVFETLAGVFEELRSESEDREYFVQTEEAKAASRELKKSRRHLKHIFPSCQKRTGNF